jgi:hypothetical protein
MFCEELFESQPPAAAAWQDWDQSYLVPQYRYIAAGLIVMFRTIKEL